MTDHIHAPAQAAPDKDRLFDQIYKVAQSWDHARGFEGHPDGLRGMCGDLLERVFLPALAAQPSAPCNAAGNRYPSDEEASRAINGTHEFAEGLRSPDAPVETEGKEWVVPHEDCLNCTCIEKCGGWKVAAVEPQTLHGVIAAVYGSLDAEDCALVDREWAKMRGFTVPTDIQSDAALRQCSADTASLADELQRYIDSYPGGPPKHFLIKLHDALSAVPQEAPRHYCATCCGDGKYDRRMVGLPPEADNTCVDCGGTGIEPAATSSVSRPKGK